MYEQAAVVRACSNLVHPAYNPKPSEGGEVAYQNLMRSLGYLNTQDFAGQQELFQKQASKDYLRDLLVNALTATELGRVAAALYAPHPAVKGGGFALVYMASKILENQQRKRNDESDR